MSSQQLLLRRMVVEVLCLLLTALGITQPQLLLQVQMEHSKQMGKQQALTQLQPPSQVCQVDDVCCFSLQLFLKVVISCCPRLSSIT